MNAETFNALYEVGIPVFAYPGARPEDHPTATRLVTRTRSRAMVLNGRTDVVWVDGHRSCIALSHVDVVTEDEYSAAVVERVGALPVPAGSVPQPLSAERLAEIREHVAGIRNWSLGNLAARDLLAEVDRLRAERHETNESLSLAAETLREQQDRIAELEALTPAPIQTCQKCGAGYTYGEPCSTCVFQARMAAETQARMPVDDVTPQVTKLRSLLAGQREAVEGEHYAAVHHTYRLGHDRPDQEDPARCLDVHAFSPRDGWRMVCGRCDHGKAAACHRVGA